MVSDFYPRIPHSFTKKSKEKEKICSGIRGYAEICDIAVKVRYILKIVTNGKILVLILIQYRD